MIGIGGCNESSCTQASGFIAIVIALTLGSATFAAAQSQGNPNEIADNEGLFVDGQAFTITSGRVKSEAALRIDTLDAHELGAGAIIFRANGKLYVLNAPSPPRSGRPDRQGAGVRADLVVDTPGPH